MCSNRSCCILTGGGLRQTGRLVSACRVGASASSRSGSPQVSSQLIVVRAAAAAPSSKSWWLVA